jgi:hypothetical protein
MIWPMHRAVWPIRPHLRPPVLFDLATAAGVHPEILRLYPNVVDELNACPLDIWCGEGRPGRGWDGWESDRVPLRDALTLSTEGEA